MDKIKSSQGVKRRKGFRFLPESSQKKCVGIIEFKGRIFVAMEDGVYELIEKKLRRIEIEGDEV